MARIEEIGNEVRLVQSGNEVMLTIVAASEEKAEELMAAIHEQLKRGAFSLRLSGVPESVEALQ